MAVVQINTLANPAYIDVPAGGASVAQLTSIKTSAYQAVAGDLVRVNPTGGGFNVTLPSASTAGALGTVIIKNVSNNANTVTVIPTGSDTIDGETSFAIDSGRQAVTFVSNGVSDWMVL